MLYYYLLLLLLVDIHSTYKVDNDPTSDTDDETQTHHSISKGGIYILLHNIVLIIYIL